MDDIIPNHDPNLRLLRLFMRRGDPCPEYELVPLVGWRLMAGVEDTDTFVTPIGAGYAAGRRISPTYYEEETSYYLGEDWAEVFDEFRARADQWFASNSTQGNVTPIRGE